MIIVSNFRNGSERLEISSYANWAKLHASGLFSIPRWPLDFFWGDRTKKEEVADFPYSLWQEANIEKSPRWLCHRSRARSDAATTAAPGGRKRGLPFEKRRRAPAAPARRGLVPPAGATGAGAARRAARGPPRPGPPPRSALFINFPKFPNISLKFLNNSPKIPKSLQNFTKFRQNFPKIPKIFPDFFKVP